MSNDIIRNNLNEHMSTVGAFIKLYKEFIYDISDSIYDKLLHGKKVLIFGNGGSAGDAQHIAGEFINRFLFDRPAIPAIALTTDTSVMTAISNDDCYENIFSRQIEALANIDDICIGISTSGNSTNVYNGLKTAWDKGAYVVTFLGCDGGKIAAELEGNHFIVPSNETPRIQECHIFLAHILCELVENYMYGDIK